MARVPPAQRPRGCRRRSLLLGSASSVVHPTLLLLSPRLSFFSTRPTPALLWLPNPRNRPRPSQSNSRRLKNPPQSVPFLPDLLPPAVGPKIREFSQPHLHKSLRMASPHLPNPTILSARPPSPLPQSPQPLLRPLPPPPRARPWTVKPSLNLRIPILVRVPNRSPSRLLRQPQRIRRRLS
jgi:hypothetical protein